MILIAIGTCLILFICAPSIFRSVGYRTHTRGPILSAVWLSWSSHRSNHSHRLFCQVRSQAISHFLICYQCTHEIMSTGSCHHIGGSKHHHTSLLFRNLFELILYARYEGNRWVTGETWIEACLGLFGGGFCISKDRCITRLWAEVLCFEVYPKTVSHFFRFLSIIYFIFYLRADRSCNFYLRFFSFVYFLIDHIFPCCQYL